MSKNYCLVKDNKILEGPMCLPTNHGCTSNLPALSGEELIKIGWLLTIYPEDLEDHSAHVRQSDTHIVNKNSVDVVFHYRNKTQEELNAEANLGPVILDDMESVQYIRKFLKDKFNSDVLFPEELK